MAFNTIFNTGKYSLFATRRPYGRLQLVKKTFCHSEEQSDVRIRNLLAANLHENARIVRFGNGLPRQSVPQGHLLRGADWLAMTGFFDRLSLPRTGEAFISPLRKVNGNSDLFIESREYQRGVPREILQHRQVIGAYKHIVVGV
jgi:hypothetical protein